MPETFEDRIRTTLHDQARQHQPTLHGLRNANQIDSQPAAFGRIVMAAALTAVVIVAGGLFAVTRSTGDEQVLAGSPESSETTELAPSTTERGETTDQSLEDTAPPLEDEIPPTVAGPGDVSDSAWFRNTRDGVVTDTGSVVFPAATPDAPGPIIRASNGDVFVLRQDSIFTIPFGSPEPQRVDLDSAAFGISRSTNGEVLWWDDSGQLRAINGDPVNQDSLDFQTVEASNGYTATLTEAVVEPTGQGWVSSVLEPARVRVTSLSGELLAEFAVSGASASVAWINDFDGRHLVISRTATEPAEGPIEVVFIDLTCEDGCVETVLGQGNAVLNGTDIEDEPTVELETIDLCPAVETAFSPSPSGALEPDAAKSFNHLVSAAQTCDSIAIRPGLQAVPWEAIAEALAAEPAISADNAVFSDTQGLVSITIEPTGFHTVNLSGQ